MAPINPNEMFIPALGIDTEPWVKLDGMRELADWSKDDLIKYNQKNRQMAKYLFFITVFDLLEERNIRGDYFEFGCHRARTFRMVLTEAWKQMIKDMCFYAFDSFEGLPDCPDGVDVDPWVKGGLCTTEEEFMEMIGDHGLYVDKVKTVKGFYNESLTPDLQKSMLGKDVKASLITIDCDLYESAQDVFTFIGPFLQPGTVLYLDDMFGGYKGSPVKGVYKAFEEFMETTEYKFIPYLQVGAFGRSFVTYEDA